jgi:hypothetical protein
MIPLSLVNALFAHVTALARVLDVPVDPLLARAWWGVELAEKGAVEPTGVRGFYEVASRSGGEPHLVVWSDRGEGWICSCPDYQHRRWPCAHGCAAELLRQVGRL